MRWTYFYTRTTFCSSFIPSALRNRIERRTCHAEEACLSAAGSLIVMQGPHYSLRRSAGRMTLPQSQSLMSHGWLAVIRRMFVLLGWMVLPCGLVWASGPADVNAYSINLSVIDERNLPVAGATVEVRANEKLLGTSITSPAGKATLAVNAAGSYSLTIQKKGYFPTETTLEVVESNPAQDVD